MCIEHQQSSPCICMCDVETSSYLTNQVVHAANCKKQLYSPAKVTNPVDIDCHQSWECPKHHKMNAPFVTVVITKINPCAKGWPWCGQKAAVTSHSPYNLCLKVRRTSGTRLVPPLICVVLDKQEQTPNVTPNAMINVARPLNASKANATWRSQYLCLPQ